jgi:hypothetical protein
VTDDWLYQLIRQKGPVTDHTFCNRFPRPRRAGIFLHVRITPITTAWLIVLVVDGVAQKATGGSHAFFEMVTSHLITGLGFD